LGVVYISLRKLLRNISQLNATTYWILSNSHISCVHIAKLRTRLFEAHGAGVGNIVAGDIEIFTRRTQAAKTDIEGH